MEWYSWWFIVVRTIGIGAHSQGRGFKRVEVVKVADIASLHSVTDPVLISPPEYNALCIKKQQFDADFFIRQCVKNLVRASRLQDDDKNTVFSHFSRCFFPKNPCFLNRAPTPTSYSIATTNTNSKGSSFSEKDRGFSPYRALGIRY